MTLNLPDDRSKFSQGLIDKVDALGGDATVNWYRTFESYAADRFSYNEILVNYKNLVVNELNETVRNKKQLEMDLPVQERELLRLLNEPIDVTDVQRKLLKAKNISKHGSVAIRPEKADKKNYTLKVKEPSTL